jgi:hypothetical protein
MNEERKRNWVSSGAIHKAIPHFWLGHVFTVQSHTYILDREICMKTTIEFLPQLGWLLILNL